MCARIHFTGEPTDGNALLYLRARYYAPRLGVFTGLDPLETRNRYTYVGGNPINRRDPRGLQCESSDAYGTICADQWWAAEEAQIAQMEQELEELNVVLSPQWEQAIQEALASGNPYQLGQLLGDILKLFPQTLPLPNPTQIQNPMATPTESSCLTNDPPGSPKLFDETRGLYDIICNIRKYTSPQGPQPADWWSSLQSRVTPIFGNAWVSIDAAFVVKNSATFTEFGTRRRVPGVRGSMFVPRPGYLGRTRADVMAAVVHELRHAGQLYSSFSQEMIDGKQLYCENITGHMAEVDAWLNSNHWVVYSIQSQLMSLGDFNQNPRSNSIAYYNGGTLWTEGTLWNQPQILQYRDTYDKSFETAPCFNCPQSATAMLISGAGCLNSLVSQQI